MVMAIRAINFFLVPKFFDNDYRLNDKIFCAKIKSSRNRVNLCMLNYAPISLKKTIQSITQYTRFLPLDGTLIFKQIEFKKPKTQPNDSRAAVWLSFWFSTRPSAHTVTN